MSTQSMNLRAHLSANGVEEELRRIIAHLADSAKYISYRMGEANRKLAGTLNTFGEEQLELDVMSDSILMQRLRHETSFEIKEFASEEQNTVLELHTSVAGKGRYSIAADPLDGSSLVDVNLAVGTIIGIHAGPIRSPKPGRESMVAAMYVLYGPLTTLVYTARTGDKGIGGVHEFVMDPTGNFVLANENIRMKSKGNIYSPGGLKSHWLPEHAEFVGSLEKDGYKLRYSGGFVPDINQVLMKRGGVFTYPELTDAPNGKLRLLFELQPMALLVTQAGGKAIDGKVDILDMILNDIDQRAPIYIGSKSEIDRAKQYLNVAATPASHMTHSS